MSVIMFLLILRMAILPKSLGKKERRKELRDLKEKIVMRDPEEMTEAIERQEVVREDVEVLETETD